MNRFKIAAARLALAAMMVSAMPAPVVAQAADTAVVDKEAAKAAKAAERAAAKARAAQIRAWRAEYGNGPYPDEIDAFTSNKPEVLRPYYGAVYAGGELNAVLNLNRLGVVAMENGLWADAERAFDLSLARIEAVYGKTKDPAVERARSTFRKESNKDFVGEPYERSMAYYYRGLLYMRAGDYENARASFMEGERQDAESDAEGDRSDFAALNYLIGWSSHCLGQRDKANESFKIAQAAASQLVTPGNDDNLLVIAELGRGPVKKQEGQHKEKLVFAAAEETPADKGLLLTLTPAKGAPWTLTGIQASSVYHQATTRGKRQIDGVLAGKASFKEGAETASSVGMAAANAFISQGNYDAGMYSAGFSMVAGLLGGAAKPEADVRMWDSLPDRLLFATGKGKADLKMAAKFEGDESRQPVGMMQADAGKCSLAWMRSRAASEFGPTAPGLDRGVMLSRSANKELRARDDAFRAALRSE